MPQNHQTKFKKRGGNRNKNKSNKKYEKINKTSVYLKQVQMLYVWASHILIVIDTTYVDISQVSLENVNTHVEYRVYSINWTFNFMVTLSLQIINNLLIIVLQLSSIR